MGGKGLDPNGAAGPTQNVVPAAGGMHMGLRVPDQGGRNIKLKKGEFILDLGALSRDAGYNMLAQTAGNGVNSLLRWILEA